MVTIMIIQANPRTEVFLNLKDEYLKIEQALRVVHAPEHKIVWESGVRPGDLLLRLNEHKPDVVHFSGHGDPSGELLLEGKNGNTESIPLEHLKDVFTKKEVKLVVLNSCFSATQAAAIALKVPVVIGTTTDISDDSALRFSELFYSQLGRGDNVEKVMEFVKSDLQLRKDRINTIVKIHQRAGSSASKLRLFLRPEIRAAFLLGKSKKVKQNGPEYQIKLWIKNAPQNTIEAVYQYNHRSFKQHPFARASFRNGSDFQVNVNASRDFQLRVTLWSKHAGECLVSTLSEALKLTHTRERNRSIKAAIQQISKH
ncbi:CHAT domain-containing protein [bacterium]|nr:CHAT domain-containing protein [bacterium]MCI0605730.1 CHAT domain-containing protein [bacterium]